MLSDQPRVNSTTLNHNGDDKFIRLLFSLIISLKTDRYVHQEARVREHARARTSRSVYVPRASFIRRVSLIRALKHAKNVPCGEYLC